MPTCTRRDISQWEGQRGGVTLVNVAAMQRPCIREWRRQVQRHAAQATCLPALLAKNSVSDSKALIRLAQKSAVGPTGCPDLGTRHSTDAH